MRAASGGLARFGLIALLAAVTLAVAAGALLLSSASPAGAQSGSGTVDYDTDGDNLIEVSNLAQLNAIRYDLDGNGTVAAGDQANYDIVFPNAVASMGCAATCTGYELDADLDFNTDTGSDSGGAAVIDADDDYYNIGSGWEPLGDSGPNPFRTTFEGNNHTISNLFINVAGNSDNYIGLFGQLGGGSVRSVHLVDAKVTGNNDVGALVGHISLGTVSHSSSSGAVSGVGKVGGLVGTINSSSGTVEYSRSSAVVTATGKNVGGLVGYSGGTVRVSYATGAVTGLDDVGGLAGYSPTSLYAVYATGAVTATGSSNAQAGGLVGASEGGIYASYSTGTVTSASGHAGGLLNPSGSGASVVDSYWDVTTTSIADDNNADTGEGKTTLQLQSPTQTDGYAGIYANWNSHSNLDDPWDFGTASQYPALKADSDGDGTPTAYEFGRQGRSAPAVTVDYDDDDDGLIEVVDLDQLNAIRWDLDGNGASTNAGYALAFPTPATGMGCPITATDADDNDCLGYELTADLDFDENGDGQMTSVGDPTYWNGGAGWQPIGSNSSASTRYNAVFDGDGHTISNLFISRNSLNDVGLFGASSATSAIRNVGLESANVTGNAYTGALIGSVYGAVEAAYSTGSVNGNGYVGGLVASLSGGSSSIQRGYSTASVTGSTGRIGGLVGSSSGGGQIKASYATGAVRGIDYVGGLAGDSDSNGGITASYATGAVSSSASPAGTNLGGLAGRNTGTITNSYWNVTTTGIADDNDAATGEGKTTLQLQSPAQTNGYAGIYANWNLNLDSTAGADDPWDFGTASQYPALKADFNRDGVRSAVDGDFGRQPRSAPVDYDTDGDNLIEVSTLAQLNAIRHDLDGNGDSTHAAYTGAFLNAASDMGCAATCLGYELTADLDFDENGDSQMTSVGDPTYWNTGSGWAPIGGIFTAIFNGNGHVIKNLFINRSGQGNVGLFGTVESRRTIGNLGLENVNITGGNSVGPLAGTLLTATVERVYATGSVTGRENTGGLVGFAGYSFTLHTNPTLRNTYSRVAVTGTNRVSGLVGYVNEGLTLTNSYFAGTISGTGADVGSLVGRALGVTAARSYWDGDRASGAGGSRPAGASRTTSELQTPTGATGIYSGWSAAIWDFGTASQYPALKYDTNEDSTVTWQEFGSQVRSAPANNPPTFTAGYDDTPNIAEGETAVGNYAATDPESDALTYAVTGTDAAAFAISGAGVLTLNSAANHETKSSYIVSVTVHDGKDAAGAADTSVDATLDLTVTVDDTLEPPGVPTGVNVVGIVNGLRVSWTAADAAGKPAVSFWVQYAQRTSAGPPPVWDSLTPISVGGVTTYDITGLTPGETYQVFVRGVNDEGNSPWTLPVQGVPLAPPVVPPGTVDYDTDDDGLIDVDSLAKLHAVRWDLDGNGASANAGYATAFPNPETGMGCVLTDHDSDPNSADQPTCAGYELTADLDFDTHGDDDAVTAADTYWNGGVGWQPIGSDSSASTRYNAVFDGDGHTISNLFISRSSTNDVGLFGSSSATSAIRNVGLESANVTANSYTGALIGSAFGAVDFAYSTGSVTGNSYVGGLVGYFEGQIQRTYSTASVTGRDYVGGLVGNPTSTAVIKASYATGAVSGQIGVGGRAGTSDGDITASYSTGTVAGTGSNVGGLVGLRSAGTITNSYWNTDTSSQTTSSGGVGRTTSQLQSPTQTNGYAGIYANWNLNLDSTAGGDDPWDFGTASQYPALKADFNRDGVKSAVDGDFGRQPRSAPAPANNPPVFTEGATASRSVLENTAPNRNIGLPVAATDADSDALTYALSPGQDGAHFAIVSSSGQLRTKEALNYENNDEYSVTVTVSDGNGGSDSIAVTITVGNESEPPGAPTGLAANPMSNGLRVTWTAPGMAGKPALTRYDVEYKLSAATAWTPHSHTGTGTTARITGLTVGAAYNVRVRAVNPDGSSGWASANGIPRAPGLGVDYDTDDDGLIEIDNLAQLNAMRWDADGDGAGGGSGHAAAFPNATAGMGCPSDCTGYELEADLNFDTNGSGGANSGDTYWNGGMGWAPFWYYGTFEGNRHTISNLYVNRPDSDYVGLFSTAGAYAEVSEVRNLGLENVDVTGREYAGGLAGRAHAPVRRVYTTGEVNGEHYVGGLVGEARNLISETYSKADVSGDGWESSNVGGLVGYLRLGTVKASYATGDVSAVTWVGGLVGHNSSSDDGGIIASYATGNLGFGGLEDADPPPGRWVDGFSSRYYLPYTPTWVGGLVGDSSGPVVASYSTGGHPISLAGFQPGERKDRSRRDLAYMMEVHWKVGGLIGKSYGRDEHDSYWDIVTSRHRPGDKDWVYGKGKTTEELQWVTGYTGIYADWNVDLDGDGFGDDPWDFGSSAHYPTLKVDWDGDGTATARRRPTSSGARAGR